MSNPYQPPDASSYSPPGIPPQPGGRMAITSLSCGVLGILFSFCCLFVSLPLSVAAIITGIQGLYSESGRTALAGLICGVIGLLLTVAALILGIVLNWDELTR